MLLEFSHVSDDRVEIWNDRCYVGHLELHENWNFFIFVPGIDTRMIPMAVLKGIAEKGDKLNENLLESGR